MLTSNQAWPVVRRAKDKMQAQVEALLTRRGVNDMAELDDAGKKELGQICCHGDDARINFINFQLQVRHARGGSIFTVKRQPFTRHFVACMRCCKKV